MKSYWLKEGLQEPKVDLIGNKKIGILKSEGVEMQITKTLVTENKNSRWSAAQLKEDAFWKRVGVLDSEMKRVLSRYVPVIEEISKGLASDCNILDVGCSPTCV